MKRRAVAAILRATNGLLRGGSARHRDCTGLGPFPWDFDHIVELQRFVLLPTRGHLETGKAGVWISVWMPPTA
jgi:hypothetical protein